MGTLGYTESRIGEEDRRMMMAMEVESCR